MAARSFYERMRRLTGSFVAAADPNALVLDFASIDADALTRVGGKALNLGVLTRAVSGPS